MKKYKRQQSTNTYFQGKKVLVHENFLPASSQKVSSQNFIHMRYGKGAYLIDQDDNKYIDFSLNKGSFILGHSHRNVVLAVKRSTERGISFSTFTKADVDLAKHIVKNVPSVDNLCFFSSSQAAVIQAIKTAKIFTKRNIVVKIVSLSQRGRTQKATVDKDMVEVPWDDIEKFVQTIRENKHDIACVLANPLCDLGIDREKQFLECLNHWRQITKRNKIVFIFDESISGFRAHPGGFQGEHQIIPDVTCLGGIIGGGFSLGAVGGRQDIMRMMPLEDDGILPISGQRVVLRAGLATLRLLDLRFYTYLNTCAQAFVAELNECLQASSLGVRVGHYHSVMQFVVSDSCQPAIEGECSVLEKLFSFFLKKGIYLPRNLEGPFFISSRHCKKDLNHFKDMLKLFVERSEV